MNLHWPDLGYTARTSEADEYFRTFEVLEVVGSDMAGNPSYYHKDDLITMTEDPQEAMVAFKITIKWDGCANLSFNNEVALHFCVIRRLYKHCRETLPRWEPDSYDLEQARKLQLESTYA